MPDCFTTGLNTLEVRVISALGLISLQCNQVPSAVEIAVTKAAAIPTIPPITPTIIFLRVHRVDFTVLSSLEHFSIRSKSCFFRQDVHCVHLIFSLSPQDTFPAFSLLYRNTRNETFSNLKITTKNCNTTTLLKHYWLRLRHHKSLSYHLEQIGLQYRQSNSLLLKAPPQTVKIYQNIVRKARGQRDSSDRGCRRGTSSGGARDGCGPWWVRERVDRGAGRGPEITGKYTGTARR